MIDADKNDFLLAFSTFKHIFFLSLLNLFSDISSGQKLNQASNEIL